MELSQLRYLVEFVKSDSCSDAARRMYVTPQTISKSIADLEKELGITLMKRAGRKSTPTEIAREIATLAEEALQNISSIENRARQQRQKTTDRGSIRLALFSSPYRGSLLKEEDLDDFKAAYPNIELSVETYPSESCRAALENNLVDAIVVMGKPDSQRFECRQLGLERARVVISSEGPYASYDSITLDMLAKMPIAMPDDLRYGYPFLTSAMAENGLQATFKTIGGTSEEHRQFILDGGAVLAFSNTPLLSKFDELKIIPLEMDGDPPWPVCLAYNKTEEPSPIPLLADYLHNLLNAAE